MNNFERYYYEAEEFCKDCIIEEPNKCDLLWRKYLNV